MEWQPIETAPKDWTHVLVATVSGEVCEAYYNDASNQWFYANQGPDDEGSLVDDPAHWTPLPEPPK